MQLWRKAHLLSTKKGHFSQKSIVLNQEAKRLSEEFGKKILLRVSIFGPIEQYLAEVGATAFPDVLDGFAQTINRFAKNSILNNKYIETKVISIDEPSLGHSSFSGTPELIRETLKDALNIVQTLDREINAGLGNAKLKSQLVDSGAILMPMTPEQFGQLIAADTEKWAKVVKFAGLKAD